MSEHGEQDRASIELKVEYKKLNSFFADYLKNISKGGTFIKTKKPLPSGTRFLFRLVVPSCTDPFDIAGEVIPLPVTGEEPGGMSIRFLWGAPSDRAVFEQKVEKLMTDSLGPAITSELLASSRVGGA